MSSTKDDDFLAPPSDFEDDVFEVDDVEPIELEESTIDESPIEDFDFEELNEVDETVSAPTSPGKSEDDFGDLDLDAVALEPVSFEESQTEDDGVGAFDFDGVDDTVLETKSADSFEPDDVVETTETIDSFDLDDFDDVEPVETVQAVAVEPADLFEDTDMEGEMQQTFGFKEPGVQAEDLSMEDIEPPKMPKSTGGDKKKRIMILAGVGIVVVGAAAGAVVMLSEPEPEVRFAHPRQDIEPVMAAPEPATDTGETIGAGVAGEPDAEPMAAEPVVEEPVAPPPPPKPAPKPIEKAPAKPVAAAKPTYTGGSFGNIIDVDVAATGSGDRVTFQFDGEVPEKIRSFMLTEPPRYVVDFYGSSKMAGPVQRATDGTNVHLVRYGLHPDKVRVVVEVNRADVQVTRGQNSDTFYLDIE